MLCIFNNLIYYVEKLSLSKSNVIYVIFIVVAFVVVAFDFNVYIYQQCSIHLKLRKNVLIFRSNWSTITSHFHFVFFFRIDHVDANQVHQTESVNSRFFDYRKCSKNMSQFLRSSHRHSSKTKKWIKKLESRMFIFFNNEDDC